MIELNSVMVMSSRGDETLNVGIRENEGVSEGRIACVGSIAADDVVTVMLGSVLAEGTGVLIIWLLIIGEHPLNTKANNGKNEEKIFCNCSTHPFNQLLCTFRWIIINL